MEFNFNHKFETHLRKHNRLFTFYKGATITSLCVDHLLGFVLISNIFSIFQI